MTCQVLKAVADELEVLRNRLLQEHCRVLHPQDVLETAQAVLSLEVHRPSGSSSCAGRKLKRSGSIEGFHFRQPPDEARAPATNGGSTFGAASAPKRSPTLSLDVARAASAPRRSPTLALEFAADDGDEEDVGDLLMEHAITRGSGDSIPVVEVFAADAREGRKLAAREEWEVTFELLQHHSSKVSGMTMSELHAHADAECIRVKDDVARGDLSGPLSTVISDLGGPMDSTSSRLSQGQHKFAEPGRRSWFPMSPHSNLRLIWDVGALLLVLYESVTIPLLVFVLDQVEPGYVISLAMVWIINLFWSADIAVSFLTSTYVDCELQTDFRVIAKVYVKSWLLVDLLLILPEWGLFFSGAGRSGLSVLRIAKALRLFRLLRLLKMETKFRNMLKRLNSSSALTCMNLCQMLFGFLMLNHFIACVWFFLGHSGGDGWFKEQKLLDMEGLELVRIGYGVALHWSITQFHGGMELVPGNGAERAFAICVLVMGLLTFSVFVSTTTDMLLMMRQSHHKKYTHQQRLRVYFLRHQVSMELMLGVKSYLDMVGDYYERDNDHEVLSALPPHMQKNVLFEARTPIVGAHDLFKYLKERHGSAFRDLCHNAFHTSHVLPGSFVFERDDAWDTMLFAEGGQLRYLQPKVKHSSHSAASLSAGLTHNRPSLAVRQIRRMDLGQVLRRRDWVCELALWVQGWQTKGDLIAVSDSSLLRLGSSAFAKVLKKFLSLRFEVVMYARWCLKEVAELKREEVNDLWQMDKEWS